MAPVTMAPVIAVTKAPVTMAPTSFYQKQDEKRACPNYKTVTTQFLKGKTLETCADLCQSKSFCVEFYHSASKKCILAASGCGNGYNWQYTRYIMNGRDHKRTSAPVTSAPVKEAVTESPVTEAPVTEAPVPEVEYPTPSPVTEAPVTEAPVTKVTTAPVTEAPVTMAPVMPFYSEEGKFGCKNYQSVTIKWFHNVDLETCASECKKVEWCKDFFHSASNNKCMLTKGDCINKNHWKWVKYNMVEA